MTRYYRYNKAEHDVNLPKSEDFNNICIYFYIVLCTAVIQSLVYYYSTVNYNTIS